MKYQKSVKKYKKKVARSGARTLAARSQFLNRDCKKSLLFNPHAQIRLIQR